MPRPKEREGQSKEEGGRRKKELNQVVVSVLFEPVFENAHSLVRFGDVTDVGSN
jgi:hypothetical protein